MLCNVFNKSVNMFKDIETQMTYQQISKGSPNRVVILLHGYGSNKEDMAKLAHSIEVDDALFIIPDAPNPCTNPEIAIPSANGFFWFPLHNFDLAKISHSINHSAKEVSIFVKSVAEKLGMPFSRTIIAGFSQGAMLACQVGATFENRLAGVISMSGLFSHTSLEDEEINVGIPYTIIHGDEDAVIPIHFANIAQSALGHISRDVDTYIIKDMGHSINHEVIQIVSSAIYRYAP
jgi:phospholipase/carboxylesterase